MVKNTIELKPLGNKFMEVTIVGDGDLVLNKMNDVTAKTLTDARKDKAKDTSKKNVWEEIITSMHWLKGKPTDFSEEGLNIIDAMIKAGLVSSRGEARRLIEQGGVTVDDEKAKSFADTIARSSFEKGHVIVKKGKKVFNKIVIE